MTFQIIWSAAAVQGDGRKNPFWTQKQKQHLKLCVLFLDNHDFGLSSVKTVLELFESLNFLPLQSVFFLQHSSIPYIYVSQSAAKFLQDSMLVVQVVTRGYKNITMRAWISP